ncbi:MAG: hypothetical protein Q8M92_11025 [Candidatus Subteraquimicrobiales bacterium]|nr:hypothetical protein [Candidatus Subteraquimicrobiales bacterium]
MSIGENIVKRLDAVFIGLDVTSRAKDYETLKLMVKICADYVMETIIMIKNQENKEESHE